MNRKIHPVIILGAGPVGLAAASHLVEQGIDPLVLEAELTVGANIHSWGHVRLFTPWNYLIDSAAEELLKKSCCWKRPEQDYVPFAHEFLDQYLIPLGNHPSIKPRIRLQHRVVSVSKFGHDRMKDGQRDQASFLIVVDTPDGRKRFLANSVIDATGTWANPNPIGSGGVMADGERENQGLISYGMPDILGASRDRFAGKKVLVVGSGHSAVGNILNLVTLQESEPKSKIVWAIRRRNPAKLWGGGDADGVPQRGRLGKKAKQVVDDGRVDLELGFSISEIKRTDGGLEVIDTDGKSRVVVDEIIAATGTRPNIEMLRELRLELDGPTEATKTLGPLIDPNHHSCGSVQPHGANELIHPEKNFFIAGMKSYGRAPTFLLVTGYEQVRSIAAFLAGDLESASKVELSLPSTGVCSSNLIDDESSRCCG